MEVRVTMLGMVGYGEEQLRCGVTKGRSLVRYHRLTVQNFFQYYDAVVK